MPWTCLTSHPLFYLLPTPSFVSLITLSLPPGEPGRQSSAAGTKGGDVCPHGGGPRTPYQSHASMVCDSSNKVKKKRKLGS